MATTVSDAGAIVDATNKTEPRQRTGQSSGRTGAPPDEGGLAPAQAAGVGPLFDLALADPVKAAEKVFRMCRAQDARWRRHYARWRVNELRRAGVIGAYVRTLDEGNPDIYVPPGGVRTPPSFNKQRRLARKLVSNLVADPPVPEAVPAVGADNDDPDAAEFATRILLDQLGYAGLNAVKLARQSEDRACTYGSGFVYLYVDPHANGHRPKTVLASAAATTVDDAVFTLDPLTGEQVPQPEPYTQRYVRDDGSLTDEAGEAALEWLPGLAAKLHAGYSVRPIPATATDIESCEGVMIEEFTSLGAIKGLAADGGIDALAEDELTKLVTYRPAHSKQLVGPGEPEPEVPEHKAGEAWPDDTPVYALTLHLLPSPQYPWGAHFIVAGERFLAYHGMWRAVVQGVPTPLDLPVAQFKQFTDGIEDFYGVGLIENTGSANEVRAAMVGLAIENLYKFNNAKIFYTPESLFNPNQAALLGTYVTVANGTEPKREPTPEFPRIATELLNASGAELDDEAGLPGPAQGEATPNVTSGLHVARLVEQVSVNLSDVKQNFDDGYRRLCRVALQLIQGFYTAQQQIRVVGEDNEYKAEHFTGADISGEMDVQIQKGTGTMLSPSAKMSVAEYAFGLGLYDRADLSRVFGANMGGLLGVQDNPHLLRVRGQISRWAKGPQLPPEVLQALDAGPQAPPPPLDPAGMPIVDPAAPPPPPDPYQLALDQLIAEAAKIFDQRPADVEPALPPDAVRATGAPDTASAPVGPGVAMLRFRELSRAMATAKYGRQHPAWQKMFDLEYDRCRMAAGVQPTVMVDGTPLMAPAPAPGDGGAPPPDEGAPSDAPPAQ